MKSTMIRLFVDIDDTLILGEEDKPNDELIEVLNGIEEILPKEILIFLWTGGGIEHARLWLSRLFDFASFIPCVKNKELILSSVQSSPSVVIVDDMAETFLQGLPNASVLLPQEFVELFME